MPGPSTAGRQPGDAPAQIDAIVGAVLRELKDERAVVRRYMTIENREEERAEPKALTPERPAA